MNDRCIDDPFGLKERPGVSTTPAPARSRPSNPIPAFIERVIIRSYCGRVQDNRVFFRQRRSQPGVRHARRGIRRAQGASDLTRNRAPSALPGAAFRAATASTASPQSAAPHPVA